VTLDGPLFAVEPPISEAIRRRGIDFLQRAFAHNKMDLEHFQRALDEMLAARTEGDFVSVVRALPPRSS
jgi:tRNA U34 5-carboxymethylaminomethyl modifying GTPase MnmE/TrmE